MKVRLRQIEMGRVAVMIPSAGRPNVLHDTLTRQPFLNHRDTYVGIQNDQWDDYFPVRKSFNKITYETYDNKFGSTCVARENLRRCVVAEEYDRYICMDDNTHFCEQSFDNLVRASFSYPGVAVIGGMQGSTSMKAKPTRFDEAYAKKSGHTVGTLQFYEKIGMMFWSFPHSLYSKISYCSLAKDMPNPGAMEDHTAALGCLKVNPKTKFVICMDAPFVKKRFQKGGSGNPVARAEKIGLAWIRLAQIHPEFMAHVRMVWPYSKFLDIARNK